jgi:hypothetical protein
MDISSAQDFDEDIHEVIQLLSKKRQKISPKWLLIFHTLPAQFEKYGHIFGTSLITLNCFIKFAPEFFTENEEIMEKLFLAGKEVLCDETPGSLIDNNVEGALVMQMMLQNL